MKGPADPLAWARQPASAVACRAVFAGACHSRRLAAIRDELIADGLARNDGQLLFRWNGKEWVKHG